MPRKPDHARRPGKKQTESTPSASTVPPGSPADPAQAHLDRLRNWRIWQDRDLSLNFLKSQFKQEVERPHKQLQSIIEVWERLIPDDLRSHTSLESLMRGVLRVGVDTSSHLYELDRLMRQGLETKIITAHRGPCIRRIRLHVNSIAGTSDRP